MGVSKGRACCGFVSYSLPVQSQEGCELTSQMIFIAGNHVCLPWRLIPVHLRQRLGLSALASGISEDPGSYGFPGRNEAIKTQNTVVKPRWQTGQ